jgi:uncharacterized protein (DUF58 family)
MFGAKSGALSGLTTRGRCLLAAGVAAAVCSVVLNERDLLRVSAFVVALPLLAALLTARIRVGLRATRSLEPERVPVGDHLSVTLKLTSTRRRTSGLALEDGVPQALGATPRFVIDRLRSGGGAGLQYRLQPALRGVHRIGPLAAKVSDPFGLAEYDRSLPVYSKLLVIPKVVPLTGLPSGSGQGTSEDGSIPAHAGHGDVDAIVRPYRQGDDLRKVHWRSTARRDEIMVRVEERPWRGATTVLLDHRLEAHRGAGAASSLEWAITFAASVCVHLHHRGQPVRLVTEDGVPLAGAKYSGDPASGQGEYAVLDVLAALQPTHRRDLINVGDPGGGQELIAVLGAMTPTAAATLAANRPRGLRSLAVLLDTGAWAGLGPRAGPGEERTDPAEAANLLRGAGWGVVVARPADPMAAVWGSLNQQGALYGPLAASGDGT